MSTHPSSHPLIPAEIDAEMTPAVRAFVHALIHSFQSQIVALQTSIVELNSRIAELESNANKLTPRNSSVPPSTEHPHANAKPRPGKKLKQGGQKGHKRTIRELIPPDQCDDVIERKPDAYRKCGGELELDALKPTRHQVWELPPIKPVVIEYRCSEDIVYTAASPLMQNCPRVAAQD